MHAFFLAHYVDLDFEEEGVCDIIFESILDNEAIIFESELCQCEESS